MVALGAETAAWKPALFDAHQNDTVVALSELILPATDTPGAKAALVNRYLDKLLHDGGEEVRGRFLEGLAWLDGYSIKKYARPFVRCTAAEQTATLEAMDAGSEPGIGSGHAFFGLAKRMISQVYYATEIGFKELNKGGRVPGALSGCRHSEHA